jgi:uncharacterized protein
MATVTQLYRYPIKGLSAEALQQVFLRAHQTIPLDRQFALAHETTLFDPNEPCHLPKTDFLMLMKNEKLAALRTEYDDGTGILSIYAYDNQGDERVLCAVSLYDKVGVSRIESFFTDYLAGEVRGQVKLVRAEGHSFSDVAARVLSCINVATVQALETVMKTPIDPLRFRGNVQLTNLPAWEELSWPTGQLIRMGTATGRVLKPIPRCAATNVNPLTAKRDLKIPQTLLSQWGHVNLGVYVEVIADGELAVGDEWNILE